MSGGVTLGEPNVMDVFTRIVPGVVLISGLLVTLEAERLGVSVLTLADLTLIGVLAFVVGMVLQPLGRFVEYRLFPTFEFSARLESLAAGGTDDHPATHFETEFWLWCVRRFDVPAEMSRRESRQLYALLLAHLPTTPYSRTHRMQAIYRICRGLWTGFGLLAIYYLWTALLSFSVSPFARSIFGSTVFERNPSLSVFATLGSVALFLAFYRLTNQFKRHQLEYIILEFYLDRTSKEVDVGGPGS
jgi:hypothetical protein